jgi:hypothetical protein
VGTLGCAVVEKSYIGGFYIGRDQLCVLHD